jgi:hypothetical protein
LCAAPNLPCNCSQPRWEVLTMRVVHLALVGVFLAPAASFAAKQSCDEQLIIKRCEALLPPLRPDLQPPCRCICQNVRSCERGRDNKTHCESLCDCSLNCHFQDE